MDRKKEIQNQLRDARSALRKAKSLEEMYPNMPSIKDEAQSHENYIAKLKAELAVVQDQQRFKDVNNELIRTTSSALTKLLHPRSDKNTA